MLVMLISPAMEMTARRETPARGALARAGASPPPRPFPFASRGAPGARRRAGRRPCRSSEHRDAGHIAVCGQRPIWISAQSTPARNPSSPPATPRFAVSPRFAAACPIKKMPPPAGSPGGASEDASSALATRALSQISNLMLRVPLSEVDALMDAVLDADTLRTSSPNKLLEAALQVERPSAGGDAVDRFAAALSLLSLRLLRADQETDVAHLRAILALRCLATAWIPAVSAPPTKAWPAALLRGGFATLCELGDAGVVAAVGKRALCDLATRTLQGDRTAEAARLSVVLSELPAFVEAALSAAPPAALLAVASVAISATGETSALSPRSSALDAFLPPLTLLLAVGSRRERVDAGRALVPALAQAHAKSSDAASRDAFLRWLVVLGTHLAGGEDGLDAVRSVERECRCNKEDEGAHSSPRSSRLDAVDAPNVLLSRYVTTTPGSQVFLPGRGVGLALLAQALDLQERGLQGADAPKASAGSSNLTASAALSPTTRSVLRACLTDSDQLTRRRAADLLRRAGFPPVRGDDPEHTRGAYFRALEILDEYGMHLVQEQWRETLQELHKAEEKESKENGSTGAATDSLSSDSKAAVTSSSPPPSLPSTVPFAWMEPAWERGMAHDNTQARKAVLLTFFDRQWTPEALLEVPAAFVAGTLVPTLADPGVRRGEHSERIAIEWRDWIRKLVCAHAEGDTRCGTELAPVAGGSTTHPAPFALPTASLKYIDLLLEQSLALLRAPELPQSVAESARFIAQLAAENLERGIERQAGNAAGNDAALLVGHLLSRVQDIAAAAAGQKAAGQAGNDPEAIRPLLRAAAALARAANAHVHEIAPPVQPLPTPAAPTLANPTTPSSPTSLSILLLGAIEPLLALTPGFALAPGGQLESEADALARAVVGDDIDVVSLVLAQPDELTAVDALARENEMHEHGSSNDRELGLSLAVWEMRKRAAARAKLALLAAGGAEAASCGAGSRGIDVVRMLAGIANLGTNTTQPQEGRSLRALLERCVEGASTSSLSGSPAFLLWALDVWGAALEALVPIDWPGSKDRGRSDAPFRQLSSQQPTALARVEVLREVRDALASPTFFALGNATNSNPGGAHSSDSASSTLSAPLLLARLRVAAASVVLLASQTEEETELLVHSKPAIAAVDISPPPSLLEATLRLVETGFAFACESTSEEGRDGASQPSFARTDASSHDLASITAQAELLASAANLLASTARVARSPAMALERNAQTALSRIDALAAGLVARAAVAGRLAVALSRAIEAANAADASDPSLGTTKKEIKGKSGKQDGTSEEALASRAAIEEIAKRLGCSEEGFVGLRTLEPSASGDASLQPSSLPSPLVAAISTTPLISSTIDRWILRTKTLEAMQRVSLAAWKAADSALRAAEAIRGPHKGSIAADMEIGGVAAPPTADVAAALHADALRALAAVSPENALPSVLSVLRATRLAAIRMALGKERRAGPERWSQSSHFSSPSLVAALYEEAWTSASRAFAACKRRRPGLCAAFVAAVVPPEAFDATTSAPEVLARGGPVDQAVRRLLEAGRRVPKLAGFVSLQLAACIDEHPEALLGAVDDVKLPRAPLDTVALADASSPALPPSSSLLSLLNSLVLFGPEDSSMTPAEDFALDAAECEQTLLVRRPVEGDATAGAVLERARGADCAPRVAAAALFAGFARGARNALERWIQISGAGRAERRDEEEANASSGPSLSASVRPLAASPEHRCALLLYDALMHVALKDPELSSPVYRFRGETHRHKARLWQALSVLAPAAATRDPEAVLGDALEALTVQNAADVKQYQERIAETGLMGVGLMHAVGTDGADARESVALGCAAEEDAVRTRLLTMLDAYDNSKRCELASVMVLVTRAALRDDRRERRSEIGAAKAGGDGASDAGSSASASSSSPPSVPSPFFSLCLDSLVPWCSCHVHQARVFAQLGLWRLAESQPSERLSRPIRLLLRFFETNVDVLKLRGCLRRGSNGDESSFDADLDLSLAGVFAIAQGAEDGKGFEASPETLGDEIAAFLLQERTRLREDMRRREDQGSRVEHTAKRTASGGDKDAAAGRAAPDSAQPAQPQRQRKIAPGEEAAGDDAWTAALGVQALARARRGDWGAEGSMEPRGKKKTAKGGGASDSVAPATRVVAAFPHSMDTEAAADSTWTAGDRLVDSVTHLPTRFAARGAGSGLGACSRKQETGTEPDSPRDPTTAFRCPEASPSIPTSELESESESSQGMDAVAAYLSGRLLFAPPRRCLWAEDEVSSSAVGASSETSSLAVGASTETSLLAVGASTETSSSALGNDPPGSGPKRLDVARSSRALPSWTRSPSLAFLTRALAPPRPTRRPRRTDLVVVASLVDKVPNLAGLARTCEVFGARCLIVPSMSFLSEKSFSAVSVTAERWLDVRAVPPPELAAWLSARRAEGWHVAGIEQCERSVSLETVSWAQKTILVLGAEKLGIPQNVLDLVDSAVEIPQLGVIRSLNVHVAGSIAIAAYTMQMLERVRHANAIWRA